jgi:hypothetical protein
MAKAKTKEQLRKRDYTGSRVQAYFENDMYRVVSGPVYQIPGDRKSALVDGYHLINVQTGIQEGEYRTLIGALAQAVAFQLTFDRITNPDGVTHQAPEMDQ